MKSDYISQIRAKVGNMVMLSPVVTLVIYKEGKVLLQKRQDNDMWAIHGGGIEPGEKYIDALYREIKEELNIKPLSPTLMGIYSGKDLFNTYPNGDQVYILNHVFFCEDYEGEINFNDGEVKNLKWFDVNNLPNNIFKVNSPILNDIVPFLKNGRKTIVN